MRRFFFCLFLLTGLSASAQAQGRAAASRVAATPVPAESRQLVLVTTSGWAATSGTLRRYARPDARAAWAPVGEPVEVVVGRSGLGWGRGLHPGRASGPQKREGDGRAPAGVYRLTEAFGYAESEETGLPYVHARPGVECVDDPASSFYNRVLDRETVEADWDSHEEMRRRDSLYRLGVVVAHNEASEATQAAPGGGSCIFLHVWRGPGTSTAGCTAMPDEALAEVLAWLDAEAAPVLVQLPRAEHTRLRIAWALPAR